MTDAVLTRFETGDQGTFGRLLARRLALLSGELPWRGNAANVSCLPPEPGGDPVRYLAMVTHSPRFGRALYLLGPTSPRAGIRIHPANFMGDDAKGFRRQLNGCVSLGERLGWMDGQKAILLSAPAVRRLEKYFGGQPFDLEVRWALS